MNDQKRKDIIFGYKSENEIHGYLETKFGKLLNTSDNEEMGNYYPFDKYNDDYFIEIKTRNIKHNKYSTLIFGENKFDEGCKLIKENPSLRIFYIFRCTDGVFYWEHDSTEYSVQYGGRSDRGREERHLLIHIKQCDIKPFDDLEL